MEDRICVDTDIVIDHLRGRGPGVEIFAKIIKSADPLTTHVNKFELLCGARNQKEIEIISECLLGFTILAFDEGSCQEAGRIYRELKKHGELIGVRDIMIAGVAVSNALPLATNNTRNFRRIKGLKLIGV